jgi:hypothetical protein
MGPYFDHRDFVPHNYQERDTGNCTECGIHAVLEISEVGDSGEFLVLC